MPGRADAGSQTTIAERSCGVLRRSAGSVRNLRPESAMHDRFPALGLTAPARRGATAHATTGHAGGHAIATLHGRASVCQSEIPYLRASTLPVARTARSTNGH